MKSFRVTKTVKQLEEQKKLEQAGLNQLEQFFGLVADPTIHVTPVEFPEKKTEPISLDGLNEFFQLLSTVEPNIPVVIQNEETIVALEEIKEQVELSVVDKAVDTISKAAVKEAVFEVPNNAKVENNIKALQARVETLQNWISKIAATGPGSGEVNFRWLDDVNRSSINDSWLLEYDAATKKFQFTENIGPIKTVQFNTSGPQAPLQPGQLGWNVEEDCLDIAQADGSILQTGLEHYIQIHNSTGSPLLSGEVVMFGGVDEESPTNPIPKALRYVANSLATPLFIIGVMTNDVPDQKHGRATVFGKVRNLNTTGSTVSETWVKGDLLWAHPTQPGKLTKVRPTAPDVSTSIAAVLHVDTTGGTLLVRPTIWPRLFYGDWYDITNQTATLPNTAYPIKLGQSGAVSGFELINNGTAVKALNAGRYNFEFSLQVTSSNSSLAKMWIWYRKNNIDEPNSATVVTVRENGGKLAPSWNFPVLMNANDTFSLMWAVESVNVSLAHESATAFCPAIPSVILSVSQTNL